MAIYFVHQYYNSIHNSILFFGIVSKRKRKKQEKNKKSFFPYKTLKKLIRASFTQQWSFKYVRARAYMVQTPEKMFDDLLRLAEESVFSGVMYANNCE